MKIDNTYVAPPMNGPSGPTKRNTPAAEAPSKADDVTLSDAARLAAAEAEAPIDIARIEKIKTAIANGEFKINSSAIADRLIESARSLLNGKTNA